MPNSLLDDFLDLSPVFRGEELAAFLADDNGHDGNKGVRAQIKAWQKNGRIISLQNGLYALSGSPWNSKSTWPDPYLVASRVYVDGVIAFEAALNLHLSLEAPKVIHALTQKTQRAHKFKACPGHVFQGVHPARKTSDWAFAHALSISHRGHQIRVTSREQTLVDLLNRWDLVQTPLACLEQLVHLFEDGHPRMNVESIQTYYQMIGNATGSARLGAFLERFRHRMRFDPSLIRTLEGMRPKAPEYWDSRQKGQGTGHKHSHWNLIIPREFSGWLPSDFCEDALLLWNAENDSEEADCLNTSLDSDIAELQAKLDAGEIEGEWSQGPAKELDGGPRFNAADEVMDSVDDSAIQSQIGISKFEVDDSIDLSVLLKARFGYTTFREGQKEALEALLAGRDVVAILPTGGGKSLIYQMWAIAKGGLILVISPLIALMEDQALEAQKLGLRAGCWNSLLDPDQRDAMLATLEKRTLDILFLAPESLFSLFWSAPWLVGRVSLVVVDEAHCISLWGHEFRPAYRELHNLRHQLGRVPIIALTATATKIIKNNIVNALCLWDPFIFEGRVNRTNLHLRTHRIRGCLDDRMLVLSDFLEPHRHTQGIVYCTTRKATDKVAGFLQKDGWAALAYHAGMDLEARRNVQCSFLGGSCQVIVATIAFGMGINKPNVRFVAHMNLPASLEGYVQEIGRAGRDGNPAHCVLIYSYGDLVFQRILASRTPTNRKGVMEGKVEQLWEYLHTNFPSFIE